MLSVKSHPPLGASDHLIISFLLDETVPENFEPFYIYDYHKADYKLINAFLQTIDWDTFFYECVSTHDHWLRFSVLINYIHDEFIPMKLIRKHRNSKDHKWKKLYRLKCEKFKKFQSSNLERDRLNYLHAKQNYDGYVTSSRVEYENSLFYKRKKNSRSFYNYIKKHVSSDILVPTLDTPTGLAVRDAEKTETFSAQFKKAFVTDNNILPPVVPYDIKFPSSFEPVTPAEAIMAMKSINPNSSAGPDNISPKFFRNCAANFSRPISTILNISFLEGVVLDEWKFANVTPIYKTGSKSNPINYRPISITSVFSKLAEFIIKDRILAHLDKNRLMKRSQHGFTAGRSVSTNLLECLDDWTDSFEKGLVTDILYFDFSKAFDSVVHSKLIHKLRNQFLLNDSIVNWIQAFLNNRQQRVKVGNSFSDPILVSSGVAQGTLLGPLLFIMYTNDISDIIQHSEISLYADDTKLYKRINENYDAELLQIDAENITDYSILWQLPLNANKTEHLPLPHSANRSYTLFGSEIKSQKLSCKDLGITIQQNLSFKEHCTIISRKATFIIRNVKMCFENHGPFFYLFLYKTYVRPILETNTAVFSPHNIENIDVLERVHRRITKYLPGLCDMSYNDRLKFLGIKS